MQGQCPHCNEMYEIDDRAIGSMIACPGCQVQIEVPSYAVQIRQYRQEAKEKKKVVASIILGLLGSLACVGAAMVLGLLGYDKWGGELLAFGAFAFISGLVGAYMTSLKQDI